MPGDWHEVLREEWDKPYWMKLEQFVLDAYERSMVYPPKTELFAAFGSTSFADVKVVILGQDPYHGEGQAHGYSFSVKEGVKIPPSLRNMLLELQADLGLQPSLHGSLIAWAERGVLLLNTVLTVEADTPLSHKGNGWETFTDAVIEALSRRREPIVFVLWGNEAGKKAPMLQSTHHHVLTSAHPSPLSARRGFFGSRPYSAANAFLVADGREPIDWRLP